MPSAVPSFASFPSLTDTIPSKPRKRILDENCSPTAAWTDKRVKSKHGGMATTTGALSPVSARVCATATDKDIVARLTTSDEFDLSHDVEVVLGHPTTVGRGTHCNYTIKSPVVSSVHFRLYAVASSEGGTIVSCEDLSSNGLLWNNHKIRRTAIILHHGDILQIPGSQVFHVEMDKHAGGKAMPFDPTPPQRPRERVVGNYVITSHMLGSGHFAKVHLGFDSVKQRQVACKTIKTSRVAEVLKEVKILSSLNHPNINRVLGYTDEDPWTHIFLELSTGGDLFTYITSQGMLQEGEAKFLGYQLMLGLVYMHNLNVSHRAREYLDMRARAYPRVQIADFGLARDRSNEPAFSAVGTMAYLPPEAVVGLIGRPCPSGRNGERRGYDGKKVDCWSLGVTLYTMLCGMHPFDCGGQSQQTARQNASQPSQAKLSESQQSEADAVVVCDRILNGWVDMCFPPWQSMPDARSIVRKLLVYEPDLRCSVASAVQHLWIQKDITQLDKLYRDLTK
ncbi:Serine/threonine-protein kinase [Rhizoctonia solani]|uniref:Serine/threonine-protein kinase n=1 Tax=Rhizoctonia solani TaxID=456999 RepID=A0A8H8NRB3_9AGAM|nr:Serine/threonine-protein kinase [Rhizoctonia solani]QRW17915.1 Serine/threonine-protein kinase [Rhizoctonia solani]